MKKLLTCIITGVVLYIYLDNGLHLEHPIPHYFFFALLLTAFYMIMSHFDETEGKDNWW